LKLAIIIVAAGSGTRFGGDLPKQYQQVQGKPMLSHSVERLHAAFPEAVMVVVCNPTHRAYVMDEVQTVAGGATRQASVFGGVQALAGSGVTHVMIHDAARPFVDADVCTRLIAALDAGHRAVIPVLPIADTVKRVAGDAVIETLDRAALMLVQTPQAFHYDTLFALHQRARAEAWEGLTDDAGLCERAGVAVTTVTGAQQMRKITVAEDISACHPERSEGSQFVARDPTAVPQDDNMRHYGSQGSTTRIGMGYDVHRLLAFDADTPDAQRTIRLGGIGIPHTHYSEGHSDADVVLHALTDAILGAIGEGDIGQHFPPSDATFKQMDSARFVQHATALMRAHGGALVNADITVIGERPKIAAYRDAMRVRVAEILGVEASCVNIKATTTERLGFEGRGEGLAAQAVVSVRTQ
jgi:2-C-methyl-D-erythritol 4-phosphate cytidylyltransferase / 2-C-methyl-D-erythritol 2,4-cyclodiphosphate synthase